MKFCIIGDSWTGWASTVASHDPAKRNNMYLAPIDNYLVKHGHEVVKNISAPGASNFGQLRQLKYEVDQTQFDFIIWMYTEPIRNIVEFVDTEDCKIQYPDLSFKNFYNDLEYIQRRDFLYAQRLYKKYKKPFGIIGGAGQINPNDINYPFIKYILPSWGKEITNIKNMPINCYITFFNHFAKRTKKLKYNKQELLTEIDRIEQYTEYRENNIDLFPDYYHPSPNLYESWLKRMLK